MQSVLFLQHVLNGLLAGTYYLLIALGLSLIFSLGGIVNLAHGAFYAIGAYLTVLLAPTIGFGGSIVVSPALVGLLGVIIERTLFRRFYKADPTLSLILTFGLAMVVEQAGGRASTGTQAILDIQPTKLHQRVPLIIGSRDDVDQAEAFIQCKRT